MPVEFWEDSDISPLEVLLSKVKDLGTGERVLEMKVDEDNLLISVIDQGLGIPKPDLDKVFDRFYRASNAADQQGSGLGLSVVKLLVDAMDGQISVASDVGAGTTFLLAFPTCIS